MWLEQLARRSPDGARMAMRFDGQELDYGSALAGIVEGRRRGDDPGELARGFHRAVAAGLADAASALAAAQGAEIVVLSGGVFQNELLLSHLVANLEATRLQVWTNRPVPPNGGGISLGQAALAAVWWRPACTRDGRI